jgi:CHAT domain-containing protein/pimeloyl-ACP methyl ester carboxylesterase
MSDETQAKSLRFTGVELPADAGLPLPGILRTTTRSGVSEIDPLLEGLTVEKVYALGAAARGVAAGAPKVIAPEEARLLAIEAADGTTLFIRSDKLAEDIARIRPEAVVDGEVDFARFRDPNEAARGIGDVLWKAASVLRLPSDGLVEEAKELALQWAKDKLGEQVEQKAYDIGSFLGAKALMWKIESRLAGRPGLYRWQDKMLAPGDRCLPGDPRLQAAAQGQPMLVLIHGTGSYSVSSYGDLRDEESAWAALKQRFPGGIFGYEHRTFSQSPIENALELLEALPRGARVSLLTHSRGGLVGDLLCLGQVDDSLIANYRINTRDASDVEGLAREAQEERDRLRAIMEKLRHIQVERYVRVACPARGTRLLSENLDVALSDFLNVMQVGGGALVGLAASALGGPVAGETFGKGASSALGVLKRLVLEIANRRMDPRMVPGIAAMCIDSPLAAFLGHPLARRRDGVAMAVIAGDTEFEGLGISNLRRRIANLFCDWRLFDRQDNDLVVDTDSMYAGLGFREGAHYLYDQDASVTHFRYFRNPPTRDALRAWLAGDAAAATPFQPLTAGRKIPWRERDAKLAQRGGPAGPRPVLIFLPGIMGSHIEIDRKRPDEAGSGNRIWFDIFSLNFGKLEKIADVNQPNIYAEDLFEMFYGDLADHLSETHEVLRCPYDWRKPLPACADALRAKIEQAARDHPGQPIRLLAHSMGGLVARTLMKRHPQAWQKVVDSGGRLLMLGTPNNGAHLMVHSLLGKTDSMRMLERIDIDRDMQGVLDIVAGFPGALSLLPRPGFTDAGSDARIDTAEYYSRATWEELKQRNFDRWYDQACGVPSPDLLSSAKAFWQSELSDNTVSNPERVCYVFGQGEKTPCGVVRSDDGRLKLLFTTEGDGSVTWASGRLDNLCEEERCWYMPVEHADLTDEDEHFPAITELLATGATDKLGRLPRLRGAAARTFTLEASPPVMPSEEELARACLGSGPRRRRPSRAKQLLKVSVRAGDLRFVDQPVLCGHYTGDAISGAEAVLDSQLEQRLSERERLGLYASAVGTSCIVLRSPTREEAARGSRPGALIVGLGDFNGQLGTRQITETVRAATVRFLLQLRDAHDVQEDEKVELCSLLIGWSSTAHISIAESVAAITRGVLEANREFSEALGKSRRPGATVSHLCFIELYRDAAISAARSVLDLPDLLSGELKRLGSRIEPAATLDEGEGVRERLSASDEIGHWSRLIVTDADAMETQCPPECYEVRCRSPLPQEMVDRLRAHEGKPGEAAAAPAAPSDASPAEARYYPERLKYVFLSQRARAESVVQQRQPGLVEAIIRDQRRNPGYDPRLGRTLFELMVPLDYKASAREQSRLLMVLDAYTANLPWELVQAENEPLALRVPMVRQLVTMRYRPTVRTANTNSACIIVAPNTSGFDKRFSGPAQLADLPQAVREGEAIRVSLRAARWNEQDIAFCPEGRDALDILSALYQRPYRALVIAGHGMFEAKGKDGRSYTGVVLSDGLLLTAVEIGLMEVVPEIVFLNCCHLGSFTTQAAPNRLAYSLARELIEMGVRCVVAAGWAVNDEAACTFASTFFDAFTSGVAFGDAVFDARKAAYEQHPGSNTWGAYQAYGDPGYRFNPNGERRWGGRKHPYVAVDVLLAELEARKIANNYFGAQKQKPSFTEQRQWLRQQLGQCPVQWGERPDVLQAIAALYADCGAEGFDAAREAYLLALQREDEAGRVVVQTIEQLANMEARQGEKLAAKQPGAGLQLIDSAIQRLHALVAMSAGPGAAQFNAERAALLGGAFKRKAAVLASQGKSWEKISPLLADAAKAYLSGAPADLASVPYNTLNALQLERLVQVRREDAPALAQRCGDEAHRGFASSKGFWDAVMVGDAALTSWLWGAPLDAQALRTLYEEATATVPQSQRQWDSVVTQWRLLARFLRLRGDKAGGAQALVLEQLADGYAPPPPAAPKAEPAKAERTAKPRARRKK